MAAASGQETEGRDLVTRSHLESDSGKAQTKLVRLTQEPDKTSRIHVFAANPILRGGNSAKGAESLISSLTAAPLR